MKRHDATVVAVVLASALLSAGALKMFRRPAGANTTVTVKQDGKVVYSGPITKEHTVELDGNRITVRNGEVDVTEADCPNQICVRHKAIRTVGDRIVCVPNRVIVQIE